MTLMESRKTDGGMVIQLWDCRATANSPNFKVRLIGTGNVVSEYPYDSERGARMRWFSGDDALPKRAMKRAATPPTMYDVFTVVRIRIRDTDRNRAEQTALRLIKHGCGDWLDCGGVVDAGVELSPENPVSKPVVERG